VPGPGSDGVNNGIGTECRVRRGFKMLYSDAERPAESLRRSGKGRRDWTQSRSSDFAGESDKSQAEGMGAAAAPADNG
jgi:hypothetical protein